MTYSVRIIVTLRAAALLAVLAAWCGVAAPPVAASESTEPFGGPTRLAPEGPLWARWRSLESALRAESATIAACRADTQRCTDAAAIRFLAIVDEARDAAGSARIGLINRVFNTLIVWTDDLKQHGVPEVWMTPLQTIASGRGDCMDYTIAKYAALQHAGLAPQDLRMVIVWDRLLRIHHAITAVRHEDRWLVLDNRHMALAEDKAYWNFVPLFSIGPGGLLQFEPRLPKDIGADATVIEDRICLSPPS